MAKTDTPVVNPPVVAPVVPERLHFKTFLLGNPNYFGTLPDFGGKAVFPKKFDTAFEEVTCLGLNPQQDKLEAIISIKQHSGYSTDACGTGSKEYIRFYVQHGAAWHDLGHAVVDVYDLAASPLPLSYAASVDFQEARKFCSSENILNVRAILSWNLDPTPNTPDFLPPWGNVVNARVQVAPLTFSLVSISTLVSEGILKLDPAVLSEIDVTKTLPVKVGPPPPPTFTALKALYANADVPSHRFGFTEAQQLLANPVLPAFQKVSVPNAAVPPASEFLVPGAELAGILATLSTQSGNTSFEQLLCAGYNPETRELEAVVQIKRNAGYSGGLCTPGSTEYVSFFAFFGGVWQTLGTGTVKVHDLAAIAPSTPVNYAVYRLSNLTSMPCQKLAGIPLRAILSWQQQPTGPNFVPIWGNVINTHVQPIIDDRASDELSRLMRIGGVTIDRISDITHLAYQRPGSLPVIAGDCPGGDESLGGGDNPFGGELLVDGDFFPRPEVYNQTTGLLIPGGKPIIYQVWSTRTDVASAPSQMTNSFNIALHPLFAPDPPVMVPQQSLPAPGPVSGGLPLDTYYRYMETDSQAVEPRTLAVFEAGGLEEGNYLIELRPFVWNGATYVPLPSKFKTVHVFNGFKHTEIIGGVSTIVESPQVSLNLTSVVDCADVTVGATLTGLYHVTDKFFGRFSIALVPITIGGIPAPENAVILDPPGITAYNGSNTTGVTGTFKLHTAGMTPCGYTIQLVAHDRAIVNSHCYDHWNKIGVGFCLRALPRPSGSRG